MLALTTTTLIYKLSSTIVEDSVERYMALPNLRRLFVESRTEAEENEYSRNAVRYPTSDITLSIVIFIMF